MQAEENSIIKPKIAVLGIGNNLLKDDGAGIYIVRELAARADPEQVDIIEGGSCSDIFTLIGEQIERLLIVDAMDAGEEPGTARVINVHDIRRDAVPFSLHDMDIPANLKILSISNPQLKSVVVIGVQAADTSPGHELTPRVEAQIPGIIKFIEREISGD